MRLPITKNFTLSEFVATSKPIPNDLPESLYENAQRTLDMLQRIRDLIKRPIIITSGYRSPAVNKAVGGVENSDHRLAFSADIVSPAFGTALQLAQRIEPEIDELGVGQLIFETTLRTSWVHVSSRSGYGTTNRVLTFRNGRYTPGIPAK